MSHSIHWSSAICQRACRSRTGRFSRHSTCCTDSSSGRRAYCYTCPPLHQLVPFLLLQLQRPRLLLTRRLCSECCLHPARFALPCSVICLSHTPLSPRLPGSTV